ncbi:hypothetical protein MBCUT_12250 [Methanobrevibacter cuticularis]|uniref:Uncharacterized protein n=1 Tax=Methanobrevibacter cuticularis TaxID=47311 RepID=A0A166CPK0_9EURY|nr:hypothetical protein [Methanobrevibacter cuticularis]KZX15847.1 hypothetical protein MBCUT_12250 [Methanobrevibacter cuticularis]
MHNGTPTVLTNVTVTGNAISDNRYGVVLYQLSDPDTWETNILNDNRFNNNLLNVSIQN